MMDKNLNYWEKKSQEISILAVVRGDGKMRY